MKKLSILFFITIFAFLSVGEAKADTVYVNVMNNFFDPANFTCNVGDVVKWTQMEGMHTTTSSMIPSGAMNWDYIFMNTGDSYIYEVTKAGAYTYDCTFHPGMTGTFTAVNPLPYIEEFDYDAGDLLTQHGWVNHSGTGSFLIIQPGSLNYPSYPSSGIGNSTLIEGGSGSREDVHRTFAPQETGSVYASFLVNVASASVTSDYFLHLGPDPILTNFRGRVFIQDDGTGGFKFGVSKASTTITYTSDSYVYGQTYLVVLKYEYVGDPTGSDDIIKLFVNPILDPTEPAADIQNSDSGTDITVASIALRQGGNIFSLQIDGIRVSNIWSEILPVELVSFTGKAGNNNILLNWTTATETNNSGFEIERRIISGLPSGSEKFEFEKIGFIAGHGTTSESKTYSFIDNSVTSGKYQYRLKQIDYNGSYAYSPVVEVEINSPISFDLLQNYPNPFNPSTTIKFNIPEAGNIKLVVYNMLGQEIKTLINGMKDEGVNTIRFDAEDLPSGTYLYKLEAKGFNQTRKMTLIK
jgi:plastocyanin